jgi:hypothetical protein
MYDNKPLAGERGEIEVIAYSSHKAAPKIGTIRMLMRLALGGAILGRVELKRRFQERQSEPYVSAAILNQETPIETDVDRIRYAAIGALAKSSDGMRRQLSALGRVTNRTFGRVTRTLDPLSSSRLLSPLRRRYQRYIDQGEKVVSEWVVAGRREEYFSRKLAKEVTIDSIEETLDYLAESPEMDELVQQQSGDLVEDIFDDMQKSTSGTRVILVDWFSSAVLRRPKRRPNTTSDIHSGSIDQSSNGQ